MLPCFVMLDLETTGGNATQDRITEIAAVRIENGVETARWSTLVNPETRIPPFIQSLTGITDAMVEDAPVFSQVAKPLLELLDGAVFVAHNVRFDHGFVVHALARLDIALKVKTLCTVRLSRKLYPQHKGHGLDAILQRHGLHTQARHRAMGDVDVVLKWLDLAQTELGADAVQRAAGHTRRQMLKLNAPPTFATRWLAPRLTDFRAQFPHIDVSITTDRVQSVRETRALDCLIVFGQEAWTQAACEPVMQERHIMVSSPKLWVNGAPPSLMQSTLLHVLDGDQRIPVWEQWIARHGPRELDARPGLNFSTLDQAINAAITGAGVVVVDAAMIVREVKSGELVRHNELEVAGPHGYWFLAAPGQTSAAAQVAEFKRWLMEQVRQAHHAARPTPDSR